MCRSPPPPPHPPSDFFRAGTKFYGPCSSSETFWKFCPHPPPPKQTPWRRPWYLCNMCLVCTNVFYVCMHANKTNFQEWTKILYSILNMKIERRKYMNNLQAWIYSEYSYASFQHQCFIFIKNCISCLKTSFASESAAQIPTNQCWSTKPFPCCFPECE